MATIDTDPVHAGLKIIARKRMFGISFWENSKTIRSNVAGFPLGTGDYLYIVAGSMEMSINIYTLDVAWTSDSIQWDGFDHGKNMFLYKINHGFARLNPAKDNFEPVRLIPNLLKVQSFSS